MSMILTIHENGKVTIVEANGRLTLGDAASALGLEMLLLVESGCRRIVLNMAGVSYADSSGVGALVAAYRTITNAGGAMKLSNLTARVHRLLVITELFKIFETYADEASAVTSFRAPPLAASGRQN
jgi:anti-sigma B factor antagonist